MQLLFRSSWTVCINLGTFRDLDGPRAVSGVEIDLLYELNVVEKGDKGDEVWVRDDVGSALTHLQIDQREAPYPNIRETNIRKKCLPARRGSSSASLARSAGDS